MLPFWKAGLAAGAMAIALIACAETDAGVTTAVKARLAADDTVKAYQIDVDTREKVVTLTGTVDTAAAKAQAVRVARETDGVVNVIDNITLGGARAPTPPAAPMPPREPMPPTERPAPNVVTDPALTAAVKSKLLGDPDVSGLKIDVDTENGVVTLTGRVSTQAEKDEALRLARETSGVKSVTDRITVQP